jgi:hypothetical protein
MNKLMHGLPGWARRLLLVFMIAGGIFASLVLCYYAGKLWIYIRWFEIVSDHDNQMDNLMTVFIGFFGILIIICVAWGIGRGIIWIAHGK